MMIGKTFDKDASVLRGGRSDTLREIFPVRNIIEMRIANEKTLRPQWGISISKVVGNYGQADAEDWLYFNELSDGSSG